MIQKRYAPAARRVHADQGQVLSHGLNVVATSAAPDTRATRPLESARALASTITTWREVGEQERHLSPAVVAALRGAGMFELAVSSVVGGADVDDITLLEVTAEPSVNHVVDARFVLAAAQSGTP